MSFELEDFDPEVQERIRKQMAQDSHFAQQISKSNGIEVKTGVPFPKQKKNGTGARANKYGVAEKEDRTYNGVTYHSKKEALFAADLELRKKVGDIDFWLRQVPFRLPGDTVYRLDFMTFKLLQTGKERWQIEFIEVKGRKIRLGEIKRKQTEEIYGIRITIV